MASDDRDQLFEKALARHLRPSASSGSEASALAGAQANLCPEPELLAAYHDGSLSPDELSLWKQHVVTCDHCQLILVHLETPLELPVLSEAVENVAAKPAATERVSAGYASENVVALPQPASVAKAASTPRPTPRPSPLHNLRWLWLVPAGAIAASFVAWISIHESKPLPAPPSPTVEIADNRQPSTAVPPANAAPVAPANERKEKDLLEKALKEEVRRDQTVQPTGQSAAAAASAERDLASKAPQNQLQAAPQFPALHSSKANGPSLSQQKQEQQIGRIAGGAIGGNAGALLDQKKSDAPAHGASAPVAPSSTATARERSAPKPSAVPSEPSFVADGSFSAALKDKAPAAPPPPPPPAPSLTAPKSTGANVSADAISSVTESVEVTSAAPGALAKTRESGAGVMRAAAMQNPHVFSAPGAKHLWRLGAAGSLERSDDKGVNWILQISGVYTDLIYASAPTAKVCWIVGTAGTILRTTDSGKHWIKLDSPLTANLATVEATDAEHAKISFAPESPSAQPKFYETTDGGTTWSPANP